MTPNHFTHIAQVIDAAERIHSLAMADQDVTNSRLDLNSYLWYATLSYQASADRKADMFRIPALAEDCLGELRSRLKAYKKDSNRIVLQWVLGCLVDHDGVSFCSDIAAYENFWQLSVRDKPAHNAALKAYYRDTYEGNIGSGLAIAIKYASYPYK